MPTGHVAGKLVSAVNDRQKSLAVRGVHAPYIEDVVENVVVQDL